MYRVYFYRPYCDFIDVEASSWHEAADLACEIWRACNPEFRLTSLDEIYITTPALDA